MSNDLKPSEPSPFDHELVSATPPADWIRHEHVSDQVQLEAAKLVDLAGSAELAKHAIDVLEQKIATDDQRDCGSGLGDESLVK
jgi:hypothetical protein